jgi:hypothetical protein
VISGQSGRVKAWNRLAPVDGQVFFWKIEAQSLSSDRIMAKKTPKMWVYRPPKPTPPKVPANLKADIQQRADQLVETTLKPLHLKPPPKDCRFNYLVDLYTKWYRHYFYFCAKYCVANPNALSPDFEIKFARLEYLDEQRFNLAFLRHTGEWITVHSNLSLDECLTAIQDEPYFSP